MSAFDSLVVGADDTLDRVFGDAFAFQPMREVVNGRSTIDATRTAIAALIGCFDDQAEEAKDGEATGRVRSHPVFSVRTERLPQGVKRLDRLTGKNPLTGGIATFEVSEAEPDGTGRIDLHLKEVG